jgi:hypothetical protein
MQKQLRSTSVAVRPRLPERLPERHFLDYRASLPSVESSILHIGNSGALEDSAAMRTLAPGC